MTLAKDWGSSGMDIRSRMAPLVEKATRLLGEGPENPTIRNYLTLLTSKLTQYDQATGAREAKKGRSNIYRLGHLLKAAQGVEDRVKDVLDDTSPEAREKFKKALEKAFILTRDGSFDLPPLRNVAKQLAAGTCNILGK
jgi:hypothetical protein